MITDQLKWAILQPYETAEEEASKALTFARKYGKKAEQEEAKANWELAQARVIAVQEALAQIPAIPQITMTA